MSWEVIMGGFGVGLLTGITGMGGGLVMTPMMIFLFGVAPTVAIGTDLIYASITKLFGAWQHWRQKTIDLILVKWLTVGSIPGSLLGVGVVHFLQSQLASKQLNSLIEKILGITYLLVAAFILYRMFRLKNRQQTHQEEIQRPAKSRLITLGALAGFIVGMTSVGSGTLLMAILTIIYPVASAKLVGTDIVQAVLVTGAAGIAHMSFGNVNFTLILNLLIGSIPGILIGSKLITKTPELAIKATLMLMLVLSGVKFLY